MLQNLYNLKEISGKSDLSKFEILSILISDMSHAHRCDREPSLCVSDLVRRFLEKNKYSRRFCGEKRKQT